MYGGSRCDGPDNAGPWNDDGSVTVGHKYGWWTFVQAPPTLGVSRNAGNARTEPDGIAPHAPHGAAPAARHAWHRPAPAHAPLRPAPRAPHGTAPPHAPPPRRPAPHAPYRAPPHGRPGTARAARHRARTVPQGA